MNVESINEIFKLYEDFGNFDYIGEEVTQLEHALQCAYLAEKDGYSKETILGSFLHDIGHLLGMRENMPNMILNGVTYGIENHENLGANYLRQLNVPEDICYLVQNHVSGKRYLVYKNEGYYDSLSDASKQTLKFQGNAMTEDEAKAFESNKHFNAIIKMRSWDDLAKSTDLNLTANYKEYFKNYKEYLMSF